VGLTGGDRRGEGKGETVSAGHSLRRQNYSFPGTITPPTTHTPNSTNFPRVIVAIVSAAALELATVATLMVLVAGR
jgi:hypothetical protein